MSSQHPLFDIYRGAPDKNAVFIERVEGLAAARERMEQIAAESPETYFVFSPATHAILAEHLHPPRSARPEHGYNILRKVDDGVILKVAWRRLLMDAEALVENMNEYWPAEYLIQPAGSEKESDTQPPALSA